MNCTTEISCCGIQHMLQVEKMTGVVLDTIEQVC
jgi:hypothetical protein